MEMLIVVALFSMSVVVMAQTFASFNQLHRKIANKAIVNQDLRFTMEMLVRAARTHAISYTSTPAARSSELRLEIPGSGLMIFKQSGLNDSLCNDTPPPSAFMRCLLLSTDSGTTWVPVTGKRVHVSRFDVYVKPNASPFVPVGSGYVNNTQPYATFVIGMTYLADKTKERVSLSAQSTVSSRVYLR
ncbi:hypothetical protein KJ925_00590 [Patescibacteria group bacterium]|nr:hypothetical protein [Patescibacteria group bacterium]